MQEQEREWLSVSTKIVSALERTGWNVFYPKDYKMSWKVHLMFGNRKVAEYECAYPQTPTEEALEHLHRWVAELNVLRQWIKYGGDNIQLCPTERLPEAKNEGFPALSGGGVHWSSAATLKYAFGLGLFGSNAQRGITLEEAENFRKRANLRNGGGGSERTSLDSDGFWNK